MLVLRAQIHCRYACLKNGLKLSNMKDEILKLFDSYCFGPSLSAHRSISMLISADVNLNLRIRTSETISKACQSSSKLCAIADRSDLKIHYEGRRETLPAETINCDHLAEVTLFDLLINTFGMFSNAIE